MIFEEMVLFGVIELILELIVVHEFFVERMLTDNVAVGKTVAHRVGN